MGDLRRKFGSLVALSALSTVVGFGTQLLVAFHFGTSPALDAYWLALAVVTAFGFYVHPLRESLISVIFRAARTDADRASQALTAGVLVLLAMAAVSGTVLYAGVALGVVDGSPLFRSILLALWPFVVLFALSELLNAVLLSVDLAPQQAWARLLSALAAVVAIGLLGQPLGIYAMVVSVLAGQVIVLLVSWRTLAARGLRWRWAGLRPLRDRAFLLMFGSLSLNYVLAQSYMFFERWSISHLETGALSAFQYAALFVNVLVSLLALPLSNLLWPRFLELEAAGQGADVLALAWRIGAPVMFVLVALSVFTWHEASPVVSWLFERGRFGAQAHEQTEAALRLTILAVLPISLVTLELRALMSRGRSRAVAAVGIAMAIVGILVLALATLLRSLPLAQLHWALSNSCGAALAWYLLQRDRPFRERVDLAKLARVLVSAAVVLAPLALLPAYPQGPTGWFELTLRLIASAALYGAAVLALALACRLVSWQQLSRALRKG